MNKPLVSALMLTRNRFSLFKKSVEDFVSQTYEFKELIIVNNGNWLYKLRCDRFLEGMNAAIKHIKIKHMSIGEMRNVGIENSNGDFMIIFDDDDTHGPSRIEFQLDICLKSNVDATLLKNFVASRNKKDRYMCSMAHGLEGSMLFRKPPSTIKYSDMNQGEDTFFKKSLLDNRYKIIVLDNNHELYEYRFHGKNTVSKRHFDKIVQRKSNRRIIELEGI